MNRLTRATALKLAAVLSFFNGLYTLVAFSPLLPRGLDKIRQSDDAPPFFVMIAGFVLSIIMIMASYGAWKGRRWGIVLLLITNALCGVMYVPGTFFAPTPGARLGSTVLVLFCIVTIVFCLWRDRRVVNS